MLRRNRNHPRALAGVIAAGLLLGGVASVMLRTAGEWISPEVADAQAPVKPAASGAVVKASATPAVVPTATGGSVSAPAGGRKAVPGKAGAVVQSPTHLDQQVAYQYNALGRRDPFQSLLNGEYVGADVGGGAPPDVGGIKVVGIVWGDADQFALVEDARGDSHILRRGDKVMNGHVEVLKRDAVIVNLTIDGQSQSVRVPLTRKGDKANANR